MPLYPIAEWLTSWWWSIFHEYGEWNVDGDAEYLQRHDVAFATAGFVYPSVLLQPTGRFLEVRPRRLPRQHSLIEFLAEGGKHVNLDQARSEFARLIVAVVEKLRRMNLQGSSAETDWEAIAGMTADEMAFSEVAGRFGLDPFDTRGEDAAAIERLAGVAEQDFRDDLFSLAPPGSAEELLGTIHHACERVAGEKPAPAWADLAQDPPPSSTGDLPWKTGYEVARWARTRMNLNGGPLHFEGEWAVTTVDLSSNSDRLSGVLASGSPTCALRPGLPTSRRFAMARAVGDYLMRSKPRAGLLTSMRTDQQAGTRSFAAELLAPAEGIRQRIGARSGRWIEDETVEALANELEVSTLVVEHQIRNHHLGQVAT